MEFPIMSNLSPRYPLIESEVTAVLKNLSGRDLAGIDTSASFFDLGFDSLLLTQAGQSFRQKFGVKITFRQLLEDLASIAAVSAYLDEKMPADKFAAAPVAAKLAAPVIRISMPVASGLPVSTAPQSIDFSGSANSVERLVKMQLQIMAQQLDALRKGGGMIPAELNGEGTVSTEAPDVAPVETESERVPVSESKAAAIPAPAPVHFGPYKPIDKSPKGGLTDRQQQHLESLIAAYVAKTPRSKAYTGKHRHHFADPRTVAGFRNNWKEMVYPIVVKHSRGARFWDLDNNEYVDVTMGFGTNLFGHTPDFVERALRNQVSHGIEVGPQSAIAGKVAQLMCEFSGMERVAFCSTGSEAVLAAIRVARTVTGRTKIATMSGAYHGINDEVLIRGSMANGQHHTVPVAPGIPEQNVQEVLVLDYGSPEALDLLRKHAHELAAVLVEPVQSRHPELVPVEFLKEVRRITEESETALVFDEIVTGFRTHPNGCQALFGIKADIATYGKVIGGGIPIGAICGKALYLDALDGGDWQYGDASFPEIGMTFFAGTFVRHPLGIRSALSVLTKLKREGPALQDRLSDRCAYMVDTLNAFFEKEHVPMRLTRFRSIMYYAFQEQFKYSSLLYFHLRLKGLHVWEARPLFLSTAHTDADIEFIIQAFKDTILELRAGGFLPELDEAAANAAATALPPAPPFVASTDQQLPLHEAQVGVWLLCNSAPDAARPYHEFVTLSFTGNLNVDALRGALQAVVDRHDGLRTTIEEDGRYQLVHAKHDLQIEQNDFSSVDPEHRRAAINAKLDEIRGYFFPELRGPFLHVSLLKCAGEQHLLVLTFHHLQGNGPSYWIFLDELIALYREKTLGEKAALPEPLPLAEYVKYRQDYPQTEAGQEAEAFWLKQMENGVPALELPVDYPRPAELTYSGTRREVVIEPELNAALKKLGAAHRASPFMVMLTAYSILLHRLSGQDDLIIGVPFDSPYRMEEKDRALFANTTNMMPLRSILYEGSSFLDHLQQIKNLVIECSEHQDYFFGNLIHKLGLPRDPSRSPFFNVTFNLESGELAQSLPGLEIKLETEGVPYRSPVGTAMYELYLNAAERKSGAIHVQCDHNADLIAPETLQRWLQHYRTLLQGIVADPNQLVVLIPLMTAEEQRDLIVSGNLTGAEASA
jgi:glutamate-1-semialdehyde aminotransferase/acyl carrier protein